MASTLSTVIALPDLSLLSILAIIIFARLFVSFLRCLVEANGHIRFD
jgi:phosphatidylglycerophosphate synthase